MATLAKASITLSREVEIEQRLNALQEMAGVPAEPLGHGTHQRRLDQIEEQLDAILRQRLRAWAGTLSSREIVTYHTVVKHVRAGGDIATLPDELRDGYVALRESWKRFTPDPDATEE